MTKICQGKGDKSVSRERGYIYIRIKAQICARGNWVDLCQRTMDRSVSDERLSSMLGKKGQS